MRRPAHLIPFDLLKPYLESYVRREAGGFGQMEDDEVIEPFGAIVVQLARRAGIHPDSVSKAWKGTRASVQFDTADKLLCAIGVPFAWHSDPELAAVYAPPEPKPSLHYTPARIARLVPA